MKRVLVFLTIAFSVNNTQATKFGSPSADKIFKSKYCAVKKDIPLNFELKNQTDENGFSLESKDGTQAMVFYKEKLDFILTHPIPKNVFPIGIAENGKVLAYRPGGWEESNPFADNVDSRGGIVFGRHLENAFPMIWLDKKDLKEFLKLPLHYYYKGKLIKNNLRMYSEIKPPGDLNHFAFLGLEPIHGMIEPQDKNMATEVKVLKVSTESPLPPGLIIEKTKYEFYFRPNIKYYQQIEVKYSGKEQIIFPKEFAENVFGNNYINQGRIANLILKDRKCYTYAIQNKFPASREKNKNLYDAFLSFFKSIVDDLKKNPQLKQDLEQLLAQLKSIDLYYTQPLGFEFPGNGLVESKCRIEPYQLDFKNDDEITLKPLTTLPETVDLPEDTVTRIELVANNQSYFIRFIKRYSLNESWTPLDKKGPELISCNGFTGCPEQPIKEKINYLKNVKVNSLKKEFSDEDLTCL